MKWETQFDPEVNTLYIKTCGEFNLASKVRLTETCLNFNLSLNCERFLIDNRNIAVKNIGVADIYSLPAIYEDMGVPHTIRVAEIFEKRFMDDLTFLETVCHNRGYSVSIFFDMDSARDWLGRKTLNYHQAFR